MKKLILLTFLFPFSFFLSSALAQQAPQKFNYQAVARDGDGNVLNDQQVSLRIAIMSGNDLERPAYAEEQSVTTNKLGLFNLAIGAGEVTDGEFSTIDWGSASHYIRIWMDADNSGRFVELGTSQLLSVPYALYAARSGTANLEEGGSRSDPNDWTISGNAGTDDATNFIGTTDAQDLVIRANNAEVVRFTTDSALQMTSGGRILFGTYNAVNMDGERNIHIGERAGEVSTGNQNAFIGYNAGQVNTTGEKNTFIGPTAGRVNTTGNANTFIGGRAGFNNTSGSQNSFIGWQAGRDNTTGTQNTFIGKYAGLSNTTGSSNTYIGKDSDGSPTLSNATAIGAGATVTQSNSVVLGNNANVGIGTSAPTAKLHVEGSLKLVDGNQADGYILTSDSLGNASWTAASSLSVTSVFDTLNGVVLPGSAVDETSDDFVFGSTQLDDDGNTEHYNRFFFDKSKGAFRTGQSAITRWNESNLGLYSFASGINTKASGESSVAFGDGTQATGDYSLSVGFSSIASGEGSIATGNSSTASGQYSVAMGWSSQATNSSSVAIGYQSFASGLNSTAFANAVASGHQSVAMGGGSIASGDYATAIGYATFASGTNSTSLGENASASGYGTTAIGLSTTASGSFSMAMGSYTTTPSAYETSIGRYNTSYTASSSTGWNSSDRLFTIGNGTSSSNRSDAMVVLKNGNIGMGSSDPDATLHVAGSMKYEDGNQADGYVLTSDSLGNASWQATTAYSTDTLTILADADNDTKVQVEESTDEDIIRFDIAGSERLTIGTNAYGYTNIAFANDPDDNTFIGRAAGISNSSGTLNVFLGGQAGEMNTSGGANTFIGRKAGSSNTTGLNNTFVGNTAGRNQTTATDNTFIGSSSGYNASSGGANVYIGYQTGFNATNGASNVYIGNGAGRECASGTYNIFIGKNAGYNETGSNKLYIANSNTSTPLIYGEFDNDLLLVNGELNVTNGLEVNTTDGTTETKLLSLLTASGRNFDILTPDTAENNDPFVFKTGNSFLFRVDASDALTINQNGNVGIFATSPTYALQVNGTAAKTGGGSWTATSDRRLKQDINEYSDGLEALMRIRPVTYHYNEKSGYDTAPEYVGVIAQELQEIAPYMVGNFEKDGVEYLNVDNSAMTYMLINAVKEQQAQIEEMRNENESLKAELRTEKANNSERLQRLEELMSVDAKAQR